MVVLAGVEGMTEIAIPPGNFSIGRFFNQESNVLVALDERSVSRRHAAFVSNDAAAEYSIVDTNSSYGTFLLIDNQFDQLTPGKNERVYHEDVVQFGNSVRVRLILPGETRASTTRL
jgi:pSer/pThr/pTyr-binding forkhead associated (FHA) protein